jgi:hypothetical protein
MWALYAGLRTGSTRIGAVIRRTRPPHEKASRNAGLRNTSPT